MTRRIAESSVEKEYLVEVNRLPSANEIECMKRGIEVEGDELRPLNVQSIEFNSANYVRVVLNQGMRSHAVHVRCNLADQLNRKTQAYQTNVG